MLASALFDNEPARPRKLVTSEVAAVGDRTPEALATAFATVCSIALIAG